MRRAGPFSRAGSVCRDLGTSVKHTKNQLRDYMEKSQPGQLGSRYRDAGIPARWAENLSLVLICRRTTCDIAAGTAWDTVPTYENILRRQQQPSQAFTADVPAKLNST